jgi:c-di-GMP-binding flagellar brake protein YcgR
MSDISTRLSTTGRLLVRSGIEIERILTSMASERDAVTASLPSDQMFLSHVVSIDAANEEVYLAYSSHKPANAAVLAAPSLTLRCNHRGAQFAFACTKPRHGAHLGKPAIRAVAPKIMLAMQNARPPSRAALPPEANVACELRVGLIPFAARLVDMGLDGSAYIMCDPAIPVCDGTRLSNVRIRHLAGEPLTVDVEIRKVSQALVDRKPATRLACRILAERAQLESIVRLFIIDLH